MGLEVYYPNDILNALLAAEQASSAALRMASQENNDEFAQAYLEGYRAALTTIALAFGLVRHDGPGRGCQWQQALYINTSR